VSTVSHQGSGAEPLFRSYWQAGFESACHINRAGARLDLLAATQHDRLARREPGDRRGVPPLGAVEDDHPKHQPGRVDDEDRSAHAAIIPVVEAPRPDGLSAR